MVSIRPDYGLYLFSQGYPKDMAHYFYSIPINHISIINNQLFTTITNIVASGVEYAVSFDFEMGLIGNLVSLAPIYLQGEIMVGLGRNEGCPYTIEFSGPFLIGISATLGEVQFVQNEKFMPLNVKKVFTSK
jgi:hypothetical protein